MRSGRKSTAIEKASASTESDEANLWADFVASRDPEIRARLIDLHFPFARICAARLYQRRQGLEAPFEDYLHYAVLGLIQAIDRFDPGMGSGFRNFAQYRIEGMILNELPHQSEQHAQVGLITRLRKERIESLSTKRERNRKAKAGALFEEMVELAVGLSIGYMLEDYGMYHSDAKLNECDGYSTHATNELRELLQKLVELLPEKEKMVLKQHYFFGLGVEEIGQQLQLTKGRVSQLHKEGLKKLKKMAEAIKLDLNL